jgi:hypothetical protein
MRDVGSSAGAAPISCACHALRDATSSSGDAHLDGADWSRVGATSFNGLLYSVIKSRTVRTPESAQPPASIAAEFVRRSW